MEQTVYAQTSLSWLTKIWQRVDDTKNTTSRQMDPTGVDSAKFKDRHADQKIGEPGVVGKAWNQAHYGNDKGK